MQGIQKSLTIFGGTQPQCNEKLPIMEDESKQSSISRVSNSFSSRQTNRIVVSELQSNKLKNEPQTAQFHVNQCTCISSRPERAPCTSFSFELREFSYHFYLSLFSLLRSRALRRCIRGNDARLIGPYRRCLLVMGIIEEFMA